MHQGELIRKFKNAVKILEAHNMRLAVGDDGFTISANHAANILRGRGHREWIDIREFDDIREVEVFVCGFLSASHEDRIRG